MPPHPADTVSVSKISGEREESEETGEFVHAGPCWAVVVDAAETAGGASDCAAPAGGEPHQEAQQGGGCEQESA